MAYTSVTLAQLRQMLSDRVESVPFWGVEEANAALNEALLMWNSLTGFWKGNVSMPTQPGNWDYPVDPGIVFGTRVEWNSQPLSQASLFDMDEGHPGWQTQTVASGGNVPTVPRYWFPISIDLIGIWPADTVSTNTLTIYGVSQTPQLVNDSDFLDIGAETLTVVIGYALHVLALKEGGERFTATMPLLIDFLREAAEENDQLAQSALFRQFIGIDMGRQEHVTRGKPTDYDKMGERTP